jgi:CHAT domain-containing protein
LQVAQSLKAGGSAVRLGLAATETAIKDLDEKGELARNRIVYFATHGLVSGEINGLAEPALALSAPRKTSSRDDGLLTASEVTQLKLNADWVVLSACNTASGAEPGAEALSGLARAFFYSGAKSLLVSHWPVFSEAATRLTSRTFAILDDRQKAGRPLGRAEALRLAMQELVDGAKGSLRAHPAYWAPFVVVGEGAAVE